MNIGRKQAKDEGTSVSGTGGIDVYLADGYPMGSATITVTENGANERGRQAITFVDFGSGWKIQGFESSLGTRVDIDEILGGDLRGAVRTPGPRSGRAGAAGNQSRINE